MTKPMHPHEHHLVITHLSPLPQSCVDGGGARIARTLYAGLGSAGQHWYRLDLDHAGASWERCADFPGPAPHCAVVVAAGQAVHVFGGFGKPTAGGTTAQFDTGYRYLPASDRWELLRTVLPLGLTGACALAVDASTLLFFGGYHREQFDTFHREMETAPDNDREAINARYMQRPIAQFDWNRAPWSLNLPTMTWHCLASQPHPGHCKATLIADGEHFYLLGGEVKPGLRDHTIKHGRLQGGSVRWEAAQPVPLEDGFAGSFGGRVGGMLVAAGGTHFPGAWQRYAQGQTFAHEGLRKHWLSQIYGLMDDQWHPVGRLPAPRANGISLEVDDGLVLIGGDSDEARPCLDTLWLRHSQMAQ